MKKLVFMTIAALFLAACQSDQDSDDVDDIGVEQDPVVEQAPQPRRRYQPRERPEPEPEPERLTSQRRLVPQFTEGGLSQDGPGLSLMIDASSLDAFHQSMELIASETSDDQYQSLTAALAVVQMYDMNATGPGIEGVLPILDGMTGEEIIERAQQIRSR